MSEEQQNVRVPTPADVDAKIPKKPLISERTKSRLFLALVITVGGIFAIGGVLLVGHLIGALAGLFGIGLFGLGRSAT